MTTSSCINFQNSSFSLRGHCADTSKQEKASLWIFACQALFAFVFSVIIFLKYNSVSILNFKIHIDAISNSWWIFYFLVSFVRSVLNAIKYTVVDSHVKNLEITDWFIGTFELLILCLALNYQRKYRSTDRINKEIDSFSKNVKNKRKEDSVHWLKKALSSSGSVVCVFALVTFVSIALAVIYNKPGNDQHESDGKYLFWIYIGCVGLNCLVSIFLSGVIFSGKSEDGPRPGTKLLLMLGVLLTVPTHLPFFIWNNCIFGGLAEKCFIHNLFSYFDVFLVLDIFSLGFFFLGLRFEYLRLKQECQWAMLNEVRRFSF